MNHRAGFEAVLSLVLRSLLGATLACGAAMALVAYPGPMACGLFLVFLGLVYVSYARNE